MNSETLLKGIGIVRKTSTDVLSELPYEGAS
jgi:hypothetical protein